MKPPIPNSYWVEPGLLLAGEHPDGGDDVSTCERIEALVAAGVRTFVDLTQADEMQPYRQWLPDTASYHSFSMPDHSVPASPQVMHDLQALLELRLASRQGVYVHCRAGIGRTGMAIGCYLREQGEAAEPALAELNRLWKQNARAARWPSIPETQEQAEFIRQWRPALLDAAATDDSSGLHRLLPRPLQRYRGCLVALAIGEVTGSGVAQSAPSHWTGNTGMTQCVAESLLEKHGFDGRDQLERYRQWEKDPAATGAAPDARLHASVRNAMTRALWSRAAVVGSHDPAQVDAAALARSAAPALYALGDFSLAGSLGADIARVTHQAPVLVDACRLFACMIAAALAGRSRPQVLAVGEELHGMPLKTEVLDVAREWHDPQVGRRRPPSGILGALDRAVRSFAKTRDFSAGLERARTHRGADRATVCAAYGALAGAYYGEAAISAQWRSQVANLDRLEALADRLFLRGHDSRARIP